MLKRPRAPVSGFTPQVSRATPGTAQHVAKDTASSGLEERAEDTALSGVSSGGQRVGQSRAGAIGPGAGSELGAALAWPPPGPRTSSGCHLTRGGTCLPECGCSSCICQLGLTKRGGWRRPNPGFEGRPCPTPPWPGIVLTPPRSSGQERRRPPPPRAEGRSARYVPVLHTVRLRSWWEASGCDG